MKIFISFILISLPIFFVSCNNHEETSKEDIHHEDHDEEHHHEEGFIIEPGKAAELGIKTEILAPSEFNEVIKTGGRIEPVATDMFTATARTSGIFTLSQGINQGMTVTNGTIIGNISNKGIEGGDINAASKAALQAAKKELDRMTPLFKDGLVTAAVYYEAERQYKEAEALTSPAPSSGSSSVLSPAAGILGKILVSSGEFVNAGDPIAVISKNSRLTLKADLPERYFASAGAITTARFRPAYSNETYSLQELGGSKISSSTNTDGTPGFVPLYFSFNSNGEIAPGSAAEIFLIGAPRTGVLSVDRDALIELQGNKYLYVVEDGHAYEKRQVKTGPTDGLRIEILSGVEPGETIVSKGASVVRMEETSAIAPPSHNHNH